MKFGLFGAATAQRSNNPDVDSAAGFKDYIDYVIEAESLGYESVFIVEHHFTGFGQVSATLNLLSWIGAKTSTLRLGTAVIVLPWHNPVLLAEQAAKVTGITNSPDSASRWRKAAPASRNRSTSSPRRGRRTNDFRFGEDTGR